MLVIIPKWNELYESTIYESFQQLYHNTITEFTMTTNTYANKSLKPILIQVLSNKTTTDYFPASISVKLLEILHEAIVFNNLEKGIDTETFVAGQLEISMQSFPMDVATALEKLMQQSFQAFVSKNMEVVALKC